MAAMKIDISEVVGGAIDKIKREGYTVQKWIPCGDELPENLTPVIITYANRYPIMPCYQKDKDKPYVGAAYCHNCKWFWYSVTCEDLLSEYGYSFSDEMDDAIEVLAWMPMPSAYEPEKE
jgi:hypothetical protein